MMKRRSRMGAAVKLNRLISFLAILFCALFSFTSAQGLKLETPRLEGFHPLDEEPFSSSPFTSENPVILKLEFKSNVFKDTAIIDFEKRQITFRRYDELGFRLWEYHYKELSDYLLARRNFALIKGWKSGISVSKGDANKTKSSVMKFQWEMPVHYPSWAQRVIGTDPPRLSINGSLTITMGFDNSTQIESSADKDHESSTGFDFQVDYQFSIAGSIGRLISINISADNQNEFAISDVFKNFKIHYKESKPGELEDEIIQEVEAGWTAFNMPGTELSGYSESNQGLFGIKVRSQLGPLSLTSVISHERGEAVKENFSTSQGEQEIAINEGDFVINKYFFLDNKYRAYYNQKYGKGATSEPDIPEIDTLVVWRSITPGEKKTSDAKLVLLDNDNQPEEFIRMYRDHQYFLNEEEGWIRFSDTTEVTNLQIAVYMRTKDRTLNKGSYSIRNTDSKPDTTWTLWLLKPKDPIDSAGTDIDTSRFYLMWRNVYKIESSNWSDFKFRIVQKTQDDENETDVNKNSEMFSDVLGISQKGAMFLDKPYIFDKNNGYLIIPPFNTTFFGNEPFRNPELGDYRDSLIYKYSRDMLGSRTYNPYYKIYKVSSSKNYKFPLGWDVMEGEIVKANGTTLQRNVDYIIDYSSGELELVSPTAKNADKISVEYQRSAMFVPEKKVFFGNRAELKLPFISENSFAGLSLLYQNVKVNEKIPQLEQEPYSKGLLDFNIRIDLQPEWMTKLVNSIPLIKTTAESKLVIDFEYARSFMDPNPEGKAYVDDFEDSKKNSTLPLSTVSWHQASPPFGLIDPDFTPDSLYKYPPAWNFYWFAPKDDDNEYRIKVQEMKDITETVVTTEANDYADILRLHCIPSPGRIYDSRYTNAWAGIMTPVYDKDKSEDQYLEFITSAVGGFSDKGKLIIQLGTIREDISINGGPPNKSEDYEDVNAYSGQDNFRAEKDKGFDAIMTDSMEYYLIPGLNSEWDTLRYGDPLLGEDKFDPGRDNFRKYEGEDGKVENRRYTNRKQGDQRVTSEDITNDGLVYTHKTESFYQYTIDLTKDDVPFIDKNANVKYDKGWRKYRIPLKEVIAGYEGIRDSVGNPNWKSIEMVRLIWTGFDSTNLSKEYKLILSDMQFVGSQWLPLYDSVGTKIEATSINNKEDNFYKSQIHNQSLVLVETDKNGDEEQESSLRLNFKNILPGDTALVTRVYNYHQIDISAYNFLSMAVYGRDPDGSTLKGQLLHDGKVDLVFRFGSDDTTYYEYRSDIYSGWQEVKIDLRKIAELKDSFMISNSDTVPIEVSTEYGKATIKVVSKAPGRQPNFSKIQWVGIGVLRDENDKNTKNSAGEIWVNEMKVIGISKLRGNAIRANLNTQWADLLSFSGSLVFTDGDFRKMTERAIKRQNSVLTTSMSSSIRLDKFMPQDWGLSLPVGVSYSSSTTRPQLKSNSDVALTDKTGKSDNIAELLTDNASPSRHYQQKSTNISTFVNFDKTANSDNSLVNLTADRLSGDFKYSTSNSENRQGESPKKNVDYKITSDSKVYTGNLKYDLTPTDPPEWTSWKPFGSLKGADRLSSYELSLLPQSFTFDLIELSQSTTHNSDTKRGTMSSNRTLDVKHGVDFRYAPVSPLLEMNYSLDISRDLQKYAGGNGREMLDKVLSLYKGNSTFARHYYILEGEKTRSQNAKITVDPKIFEWLTTTADYSTDYRGDIVRYRDSSDYINAKVNNTFSFDAVFNFDEALQNLVNATSKSALAGFFSGVDSFFNALKLNSLSFNYTATQGLVNNYLNQNVIGSGSEFLKYQLGVKGKDVESFFRGDMNDDMLGGMRYRSLKNDKPYLYREDRRTSDQKYTFSSGLSLVVPFQLSISPVSLSWSKHYELSPDTSYYDTTITFPDFSIGMRSSALMKMPMVSDLLQSFELNSSFNFKRSFRNKNGTIADTTEEFSMSPLVGIQGTIKKWPVTFSYRSRISRSKTFDTNVNTRISSGGHELDISYKIERNSRLSEINLLRWKIPVRGKTTMGLTGSREINKEIDEFGEKVRDEVSYSIKPYLNYIFTDNITGSFEYTHGKVKRAEREDITRKMALIVNIQFN